MSSKHCYKNHEHVIAILTKEFGFKYNGVGDNGEECFYKDGPTPETIFIHPMFCKYYMDVSHHIFAERIHRAEFKSDFDSQSQQKAAFLKLLAHIEGITKKPQTCLSKEDILIEIEVLEKKREELIQMALNPAVSIDSKKMIPLIYKAVIECQTTVRYLISRL